MIRKTIIYKRKDIKDESLFRVIILIVFLFFFNFLKLHHQILINLFQIINLQLFLRDSLSQIRNQHLQTRRPRLIILRCFISQQHL